MSTPQWPVPYQERKFRSYPTRDTSIDFSEFGKEISDFQAMELKNDLRRTESGAKLVENIEENCDIDSTIYS